MIPRVIHYCWFGHKPLPASALKCIASWRKFLPGYEIREWNEDNFDVSATAYTAEAYAAGKYAFVSDYARFWVLYRHGGLYFDTDVELVASIDDINARGSWMGVEVPSRDGKAPMVNPGLGLGAEADMPLYKEVLDYYNGLHFVDADGKPNQVTVVAHTTAVLRRHGLRATDDIQQVGGVWIYPADYFNPLDSLTGRLAKTANTRSVHWYAGSWSDSPRWRRALSRLSHRVFGLKLHRFKS